MRCQPDYHEWLQLQLIMNQTKPVQLPQKVQFLHEKIDFMHQQVKQSGQFQLKMRFIEFVDCSIEKICALDGKNNYSSQVVKRKYEEYYNAEQNQRERNRIEQDKQALAGRIAQLAQKERSIEIQALRIELESARIVKEKMNQEYSSKELQLKGLIFQLQRKLKLVEKELERVIKMNSGQAKDIEMLKEERARAEKREAEWREKYDNQIGILQTFSNKRGKYVFRDEQGLRIYRTITNITTAPKGCERLVLCDVPLKFHVQKMAYGIKVGQMKGSREVEYFKQVSLYEKQQMVISWVEGYLQVEYVKRKVFLKLQKYEIVNKSQIIVMLFGKGDSIAIDETA